MIDFKELPDTGTRFEQLVRELLFYSGFKPYWTGEGPDHGRDILFTENLEGPLSTAKRKWLVQCKHTAHSGRAIGRTEVGSFIDDCQQAGATGYILATSTHPSSALQTRLSESISADSKLERFEVWDSVELEKRLMEPRNFSLCHMFFAQSFRSLPWKIYNRGEPNKWSAHYHDYFLLLTSRISGGHPSLQDCELIIDRIEKIRISDSNQFIRPRAIHYDDKHGNYIAYIDYMYPDDSEPKHQNDQLLQLLFDGHGIHQDVPGDSGITFFDVNFRKYTKESDHFDRDHYDYYCNHMASYDAGMMRIPFWKRKVCR